jgi:CO/xanthine dehydrogenase Mo-binding subunit
MGPVAAAIGNALYHALGVRLRDLPLTRERILAAIA